MATATIWKIRKIAIYLCREFSDFGEIWHGDTVRPFLTVLTITNLKFKKFKMAEAAILKNPKIANDRHVWHGYAYWPSEQVWHLKYPTFTNERWRTAAILKNL